MATTNASETRRSLAVRGSLLLLTTRNMLRLKRRRNSGAVMTRANAPQRDPPSKHYPRLAPFFASLDACQDAHQAVSDRIIGERTKLHSVRVQAGGAGGDSGAPVLRQQSDGYYLAGLLWGGGTLLDGTRFFWHEPMDVHCERSWVYQRQ